MRIPCAISCFLLALVANAEDAESTRPASPLPHPETSAQGETDEPAASWLGVDLTKPDPSVAAQLPALPPGVGFLVKSASPHGPAANAGLLEADLIWKFNDQLLINEAQLSVLLRLHQPDETVVLSVFRGGSQLEIPVVLGASPIPPPGFAGRAAEEAVFLSDQGPMRVVNLAGREAYITNPDGRASVRKIEDGYWLTILNAAGDVIFDGRFDRDINTQQSIRAIPGEWKRRAYALRRGLDHALEGRMVPQRQPRPRVVPPPSSNERNP